MNNKEEEWLFFKEIGEAVTRWAIIEHELYAIAVVLLKPKDRFVLWDAYTGIENFRSKVAFVDRAVSKGLPDAELKKDWKILQKKVLERSAQRNQLVHRTCIFYMQSKKGGRTISLEPSYREFEVFRRKPEPPNDALCIKEIRTIHISFLELFARLVEFAHKAAGKPVPPVELLLQSTDQMSFRALKHRMYEELSIPQKSSASRRAAKKWQPE